MSAGRRWSRRELSRRAAAFFAEKANATLLELATLACVTFALTLVVLALALTVADNWTEIARAFTAHR